MVQTALQILCNPVATVFHRLYIRRRLDDSSGNYETTWFEITDDVKKWGKIGWSTDEKQFSFFQIGNTSFTLKNDGGQYNAAGKPASYWNGFLTQYKTLVKLDAGFLDGTTEIPNGTTEASTTTQFIGVVTEPFNLSSSNETVMNVKSLLSVLEDIPANLLTVASAGAIGAGQLTASDLITRMKNVTDGASNLIAQKFISSTAWNIEATTQTLTALDTTTSLDSYNCWTLAKKLAATSNKAVWVNKVGTFNFQEQTPTTSVEFIFSGTPHYNTTYGHTIKEVEKYGEDYSYLANKVRIKIGSADTSTSWVTKQETWQVGDSTTSWKFGVKPYELTNEWMNTATANIIASTLFLELNRITEWVELKCRFIPTLSLLNRCAIEFAVETLGTDNTLWDIFNWDGANWDDSVSPVYDFTGRHYKIVKLEHDLEKFETKVSMRSI